MKIHSTKLRNLCGAILAAATGAILLGSGSTASAQLLNNIFGGTNNPGATSVSTNGSVLNVLGTTTATIGPGFSTTVGLLAGVADTVTATMNPATTTATGAPGAFVISETSAVGIGVADVGGTFSADKTFTGVSLAANTTYRFTLLETQGGGVTLLNGLTLTFTQGTYVSTNNALSLLGSTGNNPLTVTFTTPAGLNTAAPLEFTLSGTTTAGVINSPIFFTQGSLSAVPEPGTWATLAAGFGLLAVAQRFRRTAMLR